MQKLKKGDLVEVLAGEIQGKRGRVLSVLDDGRAIVEGLNYRWKHLRRSQQNPQGGRVEKEAPLQVSRLMVVSEETDKPQRVRVKQFTQTDAKGKKRTFRYRVGAKDGKPVTAADKEMAERHAAAGAGA